MKNCHDELTINLTLHYKLKDIFCRIFIGLMESYC